MIDLLTPDEIADKLKVERRAFVRTIAKQPDFPAPVRLGPRILRWSADDIQTWIARHTRRAG
ncbi:helix-turn-helix transcriptional regulator [Paraburkholderia tropica]|uniref:helix-turn-helix transcriptional regulator n=1 Tax=Paraburkholderia tropica TaxID=92647 RepID=UPI002AB7A323|nr:AlpA family phage regulatory protein [Paraburkholderia tropica]